MEELCLERHGSVFYGEMICSLLKEHPGEVHFDERYGFEWPVRKEEE